LYAKLEEGGVAYFSESIVSFTNSNNNCEDDWINTGLGFCVMQYEAKNVGGIPVSQASGTPWVNISLNQAKDACRSIGAHLITNAEWISIARDAESVSSNWENGIMMAQGYSAGVMSGCSEGWTNTSFASNTDSDIETCIQNSNCSYTYNTGANTLAGTGSHRYRRYLILSNNELIVDFSGNAWEWVDITILGSQIPTPTGKREFSSITNWGGILSYDSIAPKTMPYLIPAGIGDIYSWSPSYSEEEVYDNTVYGIIRGGSYGGCAGAFDTYIGYAPSGTGDNVGFRCAK
jgi:formylglycine-generating enzyme required for sulfatase activity